jgi:allophanate hydrolase
VAGRRLAQFLLGLRSGILYLEPSDVPREHATGRTVAEWTAAFRGDFAAGVQSLRAVCENLDTGSNAWISRISSERLEQDIGRLRDQDPALPLYGVPFAVKDNFDAAGWPTTAGCPGFTYHPAKSAQAVARLEAAGAILLGKTNLDQFATGLAGTRSPYGAVRNPFNPAHVSGGSSAGSAVVVAEGLVPLALGTDTAGSGRIPAGFNNVVGLKTTRGLCSKQGVVPACPSLDCVAVFALTTEDAAAALDVIEGFDPQDPWSRQAPETGSAPWTPRSLAIPQSSEWFGDNRAELAWLGALARIEDMGMALHAVDFGPLFELASLLYHGPWIAERHAALGGFIEARPEAVDPLVRAIITRGREFSASDVFAAQQRRQELLREVQTLFARCDALLVPTAPTHPSLAGIANEPMEQDSRLGRYASFVNLADCCALAVPAGFRVDGLPFGVTLIAPAWRDRSLLEWSRAWQRHAPWLRGATGIPAPHAPMPAEDIPANPRPAVAGAYRRVPRGLGRQQQFQPLDTKEKHA